MKASPLSQDRLVGLRLAWDSICRGPVVVMAHHGSSSDRCGWPWVGSDHRGLSWVASNCVWLWVGLDRVSGHGAVARRGPPRFAHVGPPR